MVGRAKLAIGLEGVEGMVEVGLAVHALGCARGREVDGHFALARVGVGGGGGLEDVCWGGEYWEKAEGGGGGGDDGGERSGGGKSRGDGAGARCRRDQEMRNIYATYRSLIGDREMPR